MITAFFIIFFGSLIFWVHLLHLKIDDQHKEINAFKTREKLKTMHHTDFRNSVIVTARIANGIVKEKLTDALDEDQY